jgi:tRNA1(Val) A37 N6-methylase TrmN6
VLNNSKVETIELWLSDIDLSIVARALYNIRQNQIWSKVKVVHCVESNWFGNIKSSKEFDVIFFNPPQSPFRNTASRPDKNGGPEAIQYIEPVLSYFSNNNPTTLYELYSFMAWPSRYS